MQTHYDAQASFHLATWSLMKTFTTQRKSGVLDAEGGFTLSQSQSTDWTRSLVCCCCFSSLLSRSPPAVQWPHAAEDSSSLSPKAKAWKMCSKWKKLDSVLECQCLSWGSTDAGTQICSTNPLNTLSGENKARKMDMRKMKNDFLCLGELFLKNPLCLTSM